MMKTFGQALADLRIEEGAASLEVTPDWLQGRTAFGGWQAALAVRAMRAVVGDDIALRTLQSNFIAPLGLGVATARAAVLRRGSSATQVEARILADGKVVFQALGIFGAPRPSQVLMRPLAAAAPDPQSLAAPTREGPTPPYLQHFDLRWASGAPPFSGAAHANAQVFARFRGEGLDSESHLVAIGDAIPPAALSVVTTPTMVSSMNWTLDLLAPIGEPARGGWLRFDTELRASLDGYCWEDSALWSSEGELLALSRQCIAMFG